MPDALVRQPGTVLAFDFGVKRIGVAVGEWPLAQAHPLTTIHGEANAERFAAIEALLKEWRPVSLVVGLPVAGMPVVSGWEDRGGLDPEFVEAMQALAVREILGARGLDDLWPGGK